MADVKISALTDLNAAPAADDKLVIVDSSVSTTKRIDIADLFTNPNVTGTVTADGLTVDGVVEADGTFNPTTSGWVNASFKGTGSYGGGIAFVDGTAGFANYVLSSGTVYRIGQGSTSGALNTHFQIDNSGDISFYEDTGTTAKFFWDASAESLGIGTSSPQAKLDVSNNGASQIAITNSSGTTKNTQLLFKDNVGVKWRVGMDVATNNNTNIFQIYNGATATASMSIDSSGNLLVGKSGIDLTAAGIELRNNGLICGTVASSYVARLNRNTTDGDIIEFRKDNGTVGSIASTSSGLQVSSANTNLILTANNVNLQLSETELRPFLADDATVNLGASNARFKDLYLSGGVYLGGTGAANLLDDYEEGTFTPIIIGDSTAGLGIYTRQIGNYRKVGNLVCAQVRITWTAHTGTGNMRVSQLPFTQLSTSATEASASIGLSTVAKTSGYQLFAAGNPNTTQIVIYESNQTGTTTTGVAVDTAADLVVSMCYVVA